MYIARNEQRMIKKTVFPKVYVFGHKRASFKVNITILAICIVASFGVKLTNVPPDTPLPTEVPT